MAQMLVRGLDEQVVLRLKNRAKDGGRSLQSEVKSILEKAADDPKVDMETARKISSRLRKKFKGRDFPNTTKLIREDRSG